MADRGNNRKQYGTQEQEGFTPLASPVGTVQSVEYLP
jgi:hypothetical protein